MNTAAGTLIVEMRDSVALVRLNRPEVRNAIDDQLRADLIEALAALERDDSVRAVVMTGSGAAFCAGGDIRGMRDRLQAPTGRVGFAGWNRMRRIHHAISSLHKMPKPTIAAVNGAATGLGCDLALCCDFIVAGENASFAMSYVLRGLIPDGGGMYFLPRRVGLARAKDLIFSGRTVAAAEALAMGMIERVIAPERLLEEAVAWGRQLAAGSPAAVALAKSILDE